MKLKPANDRGFLLGEFEDKYGAKCSIQKSSLATEDCIWLGINDVELKVLVPGKGWQPVKVPEGTTTSARMHLDREMVLNLLPLLKHFAMTGELPTESKPTHEYCDECDGCGWNEGGDTIQTRCKKCRGRGILKVKS